MEGVSLKIKILPPWWKTWWAYSIYGLLLLTGIYFFDRFQRQRIIQQERRRILEKEAAQKREIEKAYTDLKATQTQLIQSEKLASLGEMTAGIAHEIQNPLNFVNNFSELSVGLADEYLRLAWHGLRAKDPNFNAKMETDFDPAVGNVEVIPQDIGRMLLNLVNNAFYAVQQRQRAEVAAEQETIRSLRRISVA